MELERKEYLQKLIDKKDNGRIKIVTGIRRCGKTYLLFELYTKYLQNQGVNEDQIIAIALDELSNVKYRPINRRDITFSSTKYSSYPKSEIHMLMIRWQRSILSMWFLAL